MIPPSLQGIILLVQRNHSLCDFLSLLTNTQQKRQPLGLAFLRLSCKKIFFCARRGFSVQGEVFLFKERFSLLVGELFASVFQGDILARLTK